MKYIISLILATFLMGSSYSQIPAEEEGEEILVEFVNENNDSEANALGKVKEKVKTKAMERNNHKSFYIIKVQNSQAVVDRLNKSASVKWASVNHEVSTIAYPNDPYYINNSLWGLNNIKASTAWQTNQGNKNVIVAVIDEGIMYWHDDLCGQIWTNPFDPMDSIDNDGNGYIDDANGWDFKNNDNSIFDNADNHGTHVSGTIGGKGDNGIGVIGVCPNVTIISAKFLEQTGSISQAIKALDYLTDLKTRHGLNIPVVSNSWGGTGYTQGMFDAIERAKNANILFVAAAGNATSNNDVTPYYPCTYSNDNVISVASITSVEQLSSFSNYGATTVDIAAPGSGIVSTIPSASLTSGYASYSGTSMATPHVSGAAALYKSANPNAGYLEIKNAILNRARPVAALVGKVKTGGTLDVSTFTGANMPVQQPGTCVIPALDSTPPSKPTNVRVLAAYDNSVTITWDASVDPESPIKYYNVFYRKPGDNTTYIGATSSLQFNITPLAQASTASCYVRAINKWNLYSDRSDTITVTTTGILDSIPPTTPPNVRVAYSDAKITTIQWDSATDNKQVTGYQVYRRLITENTQYYYNTTRLYVDMSGLAVGSTYEAKVRSLDGSYNYSPFSVPVAFTVTNSDTIAPSVPTNLRSTDVTTNYISLTWSPSTDNIGVTGYTVYSKTGSNIYVGQAVSTNSFIHTNLVSNTTYNYYITARDANGNTSGNSAILNVTTLPVVTNPCDTFIVENASFVNAIASGNIVNLNWNGNAESFEVHRSLVIRRKGQTNTRTPVKLGNSSTYTYTDNTPSEAAIRKELGGDKQTQYSFRYYVKPVGKCTTGNESLSVGSNAIPAK